jgi:hypothetical protein
MKTGFGSHHGDAPNWAVAAVFFHRRTGFALRAALQGATIAQ